MIGLFNNDAVQALENDKVPMALALEIIYPMGPVRLHSGVGELVISGQTYKGTGELGTIAPVKQNSKSEPGRLDLSLSGLNAALLAEVLNTKCQGSPAKVWLAILDDDCQFISATLLFSGKVSSQRLKIGKSAAIAVELVDRMADWSRKGTGRFSDASHVAVEPLDRFFRYVAQMSERPIYWGSEKKAPPFRYS